MATWWSLEIEGEPNSVDLEHIAQMVRDGFTGGPLVEDDEIGDRENGSQL